MSRYTTCAHTSHAAQSSIVVSPVTFQPFCAVCKKTVEQLRTEEAEAKQIVLDAYDRAMGIVKQ